MDCVFWVGDIVRVMVPEYVLAARLVVLTATVAVEVATPCNWLLVGVTVSQEAEVVAAHEDVPVQLALVARVNACVFGFACPYTPVKDNAFEFTMREQRG